MIVHATEELHIILKTSTADTGPTLIIQAVSPPGEPHPEVEVALREVQALREALAVAAAHLAALEVEIGRRRN